MLGRPPNNQGDHTEADLSSNRHNTRRNVNKVVNLKVRESNRMTDCDVRHEEPRLWLIGLTMGILELSGHLLLSSIYSHVI